MTYDPEDVFDALYIAAHPEEFDPVARRRAVATIDRADEEDPA